MRTGNICPFNNWGSFAVWVVLCSWGTVVHEMAYSCPPGSVITWRDRVGCPERERERRNTAERWQLREDWKVTQVPQIVGLILGLLNLSKGEVS